MPGALNQFRFQIMVRGLAVMHSRNLCIHTMFSMYTYEHSYEYESILIL